MPAFIGGRTPCAGWGWPPWPGPCWRPRGCPARILARDDRRARLTDLGHVGQLLHAEGSAGQLGAPALRAWLARRIDESGTETADAEDRSRRLDSDADAVQVLTIHRAKGLEFPVVYCPFLWDCRCRPCAPAEPVVYHDADHGNVRTLDVGVSAALGLYVAHLQTARDEQRGEDLRLLYVALTRARHQASSGGCGRRVRTLAARPLADVPGCSGRCATQRSGTRRGMPRSSGVCRSGGGLLPGHISVERCSRL